MISILLDHYTIKSCRRALLISSFVAIMIPSLSISGDGINFFGAVLELKQETLLSGARLISLYFLWTFCWLTLASAVNASGASVKKFINDRIETEAEATRGVDADPHGENGWEPDLEPWWLHFREWKVKMQGREAFITGFVRGTGAVAVLSVEVAPPLLLGLFAVFAPTTTNQIIFDIFT